jgi:ADP-dependent NAD(P)H-hydrate dehydratase / NAD(P)H-hydrate epimerase
VEIAVKVFNAQQVRQVEKRSFSAEFGIGADIAMAFAGKALADAVAERFDAASKIACVCGHGNNGGDGFCAASLLYSRGYQCDLFFDIEKYDLLTRESRKFFDICSNIKNVKPFPAALNGYDCVIDAVLGIGISGKPRHETAEYIELINSSKAFIVSADIPSGLPAKGSVHDGSIVQANITVSMGLVKQNMVIYPGKKYTGGIIIADVGFPQEIIDSSEYSAETITGELCSRMGLVPYAEEIHKYNKGHLLIIGGDEGMEGAVIMTARAALETGAGLVTIAAPESSRKVIAGQVPEVMTVSIPDKEKKDIIEILTTLAEERKITAIVCGPGLAQSTSSKKIFEACIKVSAELNIRTVWDGGALFHLAESKSQMNTDSIITPHIGEASRLLNIESVEVNADIEGSAAELFKRFGVVSVVKGSSTAVRNEKDSRILPGGMSALATAGSGDVLSGILGAMLLKKHILPFDAATIAVWIHYKAGESADVSSGSTGHICATDIISHVKSALKELMK